MTSVGSNFLCGRPHGAYPLPVRRRSPEPNLLPLHVNVINGWRPTLTTPNYNTNGVGNFQLNCPGEMSGTRVC